MHDVSNPKTETSTTQQNTAEHQRKPSAASAGQLPASSGALPMQFRPVAKPVNRTGLPDQLKSGLEQVSGFSMDDVKVHYNSSKPAQMQAHGFAQGSDIHLAPRQERHLAHEAWHVVQQKQGRVKATRQYKRKQCNVPVNDDPVLEKEAHVIGSKVEALGHDAPITTGKALRSLRVGGSQKVIQGFFYNGKTKYGKKGDVVADLRIRMVERSIGEDYWNTSAIINFLWDNYMYNTDQHIEIEFVAYAIKEAHKNHVGTEPLDVDTLEQQFVRTKKNNPQKLNLPKEAASDNFSGRITKDIRLTKFQKKMYTLKWRGKKGNEQYRDYQKFKRIVKKKRLAAEKSNQKDAIENLKSSTHYQQPHVYAHAKANDTGSDVEESFKRKKIYTATRIDNLIANTADMPEYQKFFKTFKATMSVIKDRIEGMRDDLIVSFYYSGDDHDIIMNSDGLLSSEALTSGSSAPVNSHTMGDDKNKYKTDDFVFGFVEHKNQDFNHKTRFIYPATSNGEVRTFGQVDQALRSFEAELNVDDVFVYYAEGYPCHYAWDADVLWDGDYQPMEIKVGEYLKWLRSERDVKAGEALRGRRIYRSFNYMADNPASIMLGGDFVQDRQEIGHLRLKQNAIAEKVIAGNENAETGGSKAERLLSNYVQFIWDRLYQRYVENRTIENKHSEAYPDIAGFDEFIEELDGCTSDQEFWSYITRKVAQPQFMTAKSIPHTVKEMHQDSLSDYFYYNSENNRFEKK